MTSGRRRAIEWLQRVLGSLPIDEALITELNKVVVDDDQNADEIVEDAIREWISRGRE